MNERLTIEVLSPYLPYELKVWHVGFVDITKNIERVDVLESLSDECATFKNGCDYYFDSEENECEFQPILRPLSDLTKEIEHNGEKFVPMKVIENMNEFGNGVFIQTNSNSDNFGKLDFWVEDENGFTFTEMIAVYNYILSLHFDVFGLIDKGLAIDINTLTK